MRDMKLSSNFWLREFLRSDVATRKGIDNTPNAQQVENLARLCNDLLEPVRATLGHRTIFVSSGFRCPELNAAIGGSKTSNHMQGLAADIIVAGMTPLAVCEAIEAVTWPALDQCIFEGTWTHLGAAQAGHLARHEYLTAHFQNGSVNYTRGITA